MIDHCVKRNINLFAKLKFLKSALTICMRQSTEMSNTKLIQTDIEY
jgi:hypothetical protein